MLKRKSPKTLLESRIRELKRKVLHTRDKGTLSVYKSHIQYLETNLKESRF